MVFKKLILLICILLLIPGSVATGQIIVDGAETIQQFGMTPSESLNNESISDRPLIEYAQSLRSYYLKPSSELTSEAVIPGRPIIKYSQSLRRYYLQPSSKLTSEAIINPRPIIEYSQSMRSYYLEPSSELTSEAVIPPRIVVEYAQSLFSSSLISMDGEPDPEPGPDPDPIPDPDPDPEPGPTDVPVITTPEQTVSTSNITIVGTAEPNASIRISGGASEATGEAGDSGNFSITVPLTPDSVNNLIITAEAPGKTESEAASVAIKHESIPEVKLQTNKEIYDVGETIEVTYSNLPGNETDWITLVPKDSEHSRYYEWFYTGGSVEGIYSFSGVAAGFYEVRLFYNWPEGGYELQDSIIIKVVDPDNIVNIPDSKLQTAIEQELNLTAGFITITDMESLTKLSAAEMGITNLSGLEYAVNLKELQLWGNQINNLSPLENISGLERLYLANNRIDDLTHLSKITSLTHLQLTGNDITVIAPLASLNKVEFLALGNNNISDISILAGLNNLVDLRLHTNQIKDISALSGLTRLERLFLSRNQISDITALANLTNLESLQLDSNQIINLTPLANLKGLLMLKLNSNEINDLQPLSDLINLRHLYLSHNAIESLEALANLNDLFSLTLHENKITDISPLEYLDSLNLLYLQYNRINIDPGSTAMSIINQLAETVTEFYYEPQYEHERPKIKYGYVLGGEKITVADSIAILRHLVGLKKLEPDALQAAMLSGKGYLSVQDAILILRLVVGLIEYEDLPVNKNPY